MIRQQLTRKAFLDPSNKYVCSECITKRFFGSSASWASPVRSPKVRNRERVERENHRRGISPDGHQLRSTTPDRLNRSYADVLPPDLPPLGHLQSAFANGTLGVDVDKAIRVLHAFIRLNSRTQTELEKLLRDHHLEPHNLTLLARVQGRCNSLPQRQVYQNLLLAACTLSDPEATFRVVQQAIKLQKLTHPQFQEALRNLESLANQKHPQALYLKGQIALSRCDEANAMRYFEEGTRSEYKIPDNSYDVGGYGDMWLALGQGYLNRRNFDEARTAFKVAADMDDPVAYHHLANLPKTPSEEKEVFLLKAASSGITKAAHGLGRLYIERGKSCSAGETDSWRLKAREWFSVAASDKHVLSLIELAVMDLKSGVSESGLDLLEEAENCDGAKEFAGEIRDVRHSLMELNAKEKQSKQKDGWVDKLMALVNGRRLSRSPCTPSRDGYP